eukprot:1010034-Pleurochrysis_carterae.AAC.1
MSSRAARLLEDRLPSSPWRTQHGCGVRTCPVCLPSTCAICLMSHDCRCTCHARTCSATPLGR